MCMEFANIQGVTTEYVNLEKKIRKRSYFTFNRGFYRTERIKHLISDCSGMSVAHSSGLFNVFATIRGPHALLDFLVVLVFNSENVFVGN